MMNHIVPDFETDEDYSTPEVPKKSTMGGNEDIMELLWHNGQVVVQSQNQRSVGNKKPSVAPATREIRSSVVEEDTVGPSDMFMQEDEMASWLHYPAEDNSLESYLYSNDLLYPTPPLSAPIPAASTSLPPPPPPSVVIPSRPPVPPYRRLEVESGPQKYSNFLHFSRPNKGRSPESGPLSSDKVAPTIRPSPSTVVASNETPAAAARPESRVSRVSDIPATVSAGNVGGGGSTSGIGAAGTSSAGREVETCDVSVTSSPGTGGSGASASMEPPSSQIQPAPAEDRKRKGRDTDDTECHSEDVEFEYPDAKKQSHGGSTSIRRSRAAEVHNLSERRRRDRINEKMKALQELIPRCNKSDKASMLDEAIEYLKSLQMQVQMMSMGCSMVPVMFPGVQQYMPPMAMGMGMSLGMGMEMNRAMVPYPGILPGSSLPNPAAAAAHLGQRFPVPGFNMPPVTVAGPAASQSANLSAPMMNSFPINSQNQPRLPNFADPYQQYLGLHQTQLPLPQQNQGGMPGNIATKPGSSKDATNPDHHQTG